MERADGILFALEAQGLNLEGTELVVLSACDTAQGSLDYSEGVFFGLARALRTAGARNVLVTLWKLNDGEARDFMVEFYKTWLAQVRSDPAKALRVTQSRLGTLHPHRVTKMAERPPQCHLSACSRPSPRRHRQTSAML
jgi:CHAT domain-containing protein